MADSEAWRRRRDDEMRAAEPEPWFIRQAREGRVAAGVQAEPMRQAAGGYVPPPPLDDGDYPSEQIFMRGPVGLREPGEPSSSGGTGTARRWWPALTGALVILALAFGWLLRGLDEPAAPQLAAAVPPDLPALLPAAAVASAQTTCGRTETLQGLAAVIFGQARRTGVPNAAWIERVATAATVRVDDAHVKTLDVADSITVCSGRLALRLPPGATGVPVPPLTAAVDYTVQPAVDSRGRVYRLDGAEPIVRQLVALVPVETPEEVAVAAPEPRATVPPKGAPVKPAPRVVLAALPPVPAARAERPVPRTATPAAAVEDTRPDPAPRRECSGDLTPGEQAVCADPMLAALDGEMNALFFGIVRHGDERIVRKAQKSREKFIDRRERCDDEACIAKAYRNRIEDLADFGLPRVGAGEAAEVRPRPPGVLRVGEETSRLPECRGFESYRPSVPCRTVQSRRAKPRDVEREI